MTISLASTVAAEWREIQLLKDLRDRIVHVDGIVKSGDQKLRNLRSQSLRRPDELNLVEDDDGVISVSVTDKYLRRIFQNIHCFFSLFHKNNRERLRSLKDRYVKNELADRAD